MLYHRILLVDDDVQMLCLLKESLMDKYIILTIIWFVSISDCSGLSITFAIKDYSAPDAM